MTVLSTEPGIPSSHLLVVMGDRASANSVAPSVKDIHVGCFSHTLDLVEDNFKVSTLNSFMKYWERIFKHIHKVVFYVVSRLVQCRW